MPIELVIGGVMLLPIVVGLVEFAKRVFDLPSEHAPLLNGALTTLAYALMMFVRSNPSYEEMVAGVLMGVVVFLANAGFYEMLVKPHLRKKELEETISERLYRYPDSWADSGVDDEAPGNESS